MKEVYQKRRSTFMKQLQKNSMVILYSGQAPMRSMDEEYPFSVDRNFYYFTGIDRENMILLLSNIGTATMEEILFIEPYDEFVAKWFGERMRAETATAISGIEKIEKIDTFEEKLHGQIRRNRGCQTLHVGLDLWRYQVEQADTKAHQLAIQLHYKYPAIVIDDIYEQLVGSRILKSDMEIEQMKVAQETTRLAIEEVMVYAKPGMNECELEGAFDFALKKQGVKEHAFPSIVAGGGRATTLHYRDNDQVIANGELVLLDLGSAYNHYCADISRTFPINGTFTKRQKEIYNVVLEAQKLVIETAKQGMTLKDLNDLVIALYERRLPDLGLMEEGQKVEDYYYHGVSHQLGLDTHDIECETYRVLQPGMIITVEPGLYIAEEQIGIRIENDILITQGKAIDLSSKILKTVEEIEVWMQGGGNENVVSGGHNREKSS